MGKNIIKYFIKSEMVQNLEENYLHQAKYRQFGDNQQGELDDLDGNQQQKPFVILLWEVISQPCDVSEMMGGQVDEKADVAVKSSRIFCSSKNNMCLVDGKRRLNLLSE